MLQYIVTGKNASEIIDIASEALANGCRWIRLDLCALKTKEIETTVKSLQEKCTQVEAFMTIENDVDTASSMKMAGVHLGIDSNIKAVDARKQLGEEPIIGITIAEAAEVPFVPRSAIDYIAVASDDLHTCSRVVEQMKTTGLEEPVIAPYSRSTSLSTLMATGINGIAVNNHTTPPAKLQELLKELNTLVKQRLEGL